jgi:hypothetical protein
MTYLLLKNYSASRVHAVNSTKSIVLPGIDVTFGLPRQDTEVLVASAPGRPNYFLLTPNIFWFSIWNLFHITILAYRILRRNLLFSLLLH